LSRHLERIVEYYRNGLIQPIHPVTTFTASKVEDAFRVLQRGQHIGKIVVSMPANTTSTKTDQKILRLRGDAPYLLVGGLGGLGQSVSRWLAEQGARHLIVLSPSAGKKQEHELFIKELRHLGCKLDAIAGSVASLDDVYRAFNASSEPIAGIIQASMILKV